MADVTMHKIEPGTVIVLRGVFFGDDHPEALDELVAQLTEVAGHDRFLMLTIEGGGEVKTYGPGDIPALVEEILGAG